TAVDLAAGVWEAEGIRNGTEGSQGSKEGKREAGGEEVTTGGDVFTCPHCYKPIETLPSARVSWWRYDPGDPKVGLGCGSLVAIAIIVYLCSGGFNDSDELKALQKEVHALSQKVDALSEAVKPAAVEAAPKAERGQP